MSDESDRARYEQDCLEEMIRMRQPLDAPIRMRERQREADAKRLKEWLESDEGKAMIAEIVRDALGKEKVQP